MSWFPSFTLTALGQVQAVTSGTVTSTIGAQGYVAANPLVSEDAIAATDNFFGALRYSSGGALRIYDATAGLPATTYMVGGMRVTPEGQLCITTDDVTGGDLIYVQGVAIANDGRAYMDVPA